MKKLFKNSHFNRKPSAAVYAGFIYMLIAGLWLLVSEYLISRLFGNSLEFHNYHFYNLFLFITINAIFLFLLLRGNLSRFFSEQSGDRALFDPLTHLPNRALFYDRLKQALMKAERENQSVAVLIVGFSRLRESYNSSGPRYGELILTETGARLKKMIRQADTISRIEEYQFGICLSNSGREGAALVAGNILKVLEEPLILEGLSFEIEFNIGIALYPEHAENYEHLMRCAEAGRAQAKIDGLGFEMYALQKDQRAKQTLTLLEELHQAIDHNELFMVYQPKIDLKTGRVSGAEALVRWRHPSWGIIPPDQFIPMAENSELIKSLSDWVINDVLRQCHDWANQGFELPVAINLSRRNVHDPNIFSQIVDGLESWRVPPELLELEITESVIMANVGAAINFLSRLRNMGIQISIDDFGTGYSSLGSLKKLPVSTAKIDKSFVINMASDKDDEMIVKSTIDLAHNLGLKVVAEGVENQETWARLAAMGCDQLQGYFISHPLPADDFIRWLDDSPFGIKKTGPAAQNARK